MRVIAFSLWGTDLRYRAGMIENCKLAATHYPGWRVRIYAERWCVDAIGPNCPQADFRVMPKSYGWSGLFWRLDVASDPSVEAWIIRDADSRLNKREALAVREWLSGDKAFHAMRDHINHVAPIMGGMWGGRRMMPEMPDYIAGCTNREQYFSDQTMLSYKVWPSIKHDTLVHGFGGKWWPEGAQLDRGLFVGQRYNEYGEPEYA